MRLNEMVKLICAFIIFALFPVASYAHTGTGAIHSFSHGLLHPLTGADHVLAMLGVGILGYKLGKHALWALPAVFLSMMLVGGAVSVFSIPPTYIEIGITLSVFVIGFMLSMSFSISITIAALIVGFFAVFHGHAHAAEAVSGMLSMAYAFGFLASTFALHMIGILLALGANKLEKSSLRYAG